MKFTIPEGVDMIKLSIIDNPTTYGYAEGNDFAMDDIEVHLCSNAEYHTFDTIVCDTILPFTWRGIEWTKADTIGKLFKDVSGEDSVYAVYTLKTVHCPYPPVSVIQDTTICDTISQLVLHGRTYPSSPVVQDTLMDSYGYDSVYCTWNISTYHCPYPPVTIREDTLICDTINIVKWRNKTYPVETILKDTLYDSYGADSVYFILQTTTQACCPDILIFRLDTTICDTLLPFLWLFRDTILLYEDIGTQEVEVPHSRWENCIGEVYMLTLDTIHLERLYPIIVNKYNRQLLCHNTRVSELFPDLTPTAYQWYKNGDAIPDATEDDYSEQNELQGDFQLRILMSDGRYVWSEILTIQPAQTQAPSRIMIYNHNGYLFYQSDTETVIPPLQRGLYIIQAEQNGEQHTEKKLVP